MIAAFVDTSVLVAISFQEDGCAEVAARLQEFDAVFGSDLLEAELRSACAREQRDVDTRLFDQVRFIYQPRSLRAEFIQVLGAGYLRGADCFHLAVALSLTASPKELTFLTLDERQRNVAAALGFAT